MSKKISILLPVFNCGLYIKSAIQSIINNSFENYEIIVINDGSTDNTLDIINQFNDPRIKIYNKENSGLVETLNYGLKKCNYPIIMRMDGDDVIHQKKIETQLNYFSRNESVLVGTQGFTIDLNEDKTGKINLPLTHDKIIKSLLKLSSGLIHPSIMFYKDALLKIGGYNQNFKHAEDYEMYLRLSKIGKISNIEDKLIYLRKHDTNVSLVYAEDQIKNSIISREIYLKSNTLLISKKIYDEYKRELNKKIIYKIYIKVQTRIVFFENNRTKLNSIFTIILKLIRRLLKLIL
jgi:glycosyltransferase involved in cell wall biosynthesis